MCPQTYVSFVYKPLVYQQTAIKLNSFEQRFRQKYTNNQTVHILLWITKRNRSSKAFSTTDKNLQKFWQSQVLSLTPSQYHWEPTWLGAW